MQSEIIDRPKGGIGGIVVMGNAHGSAIIDPLGLEAPEDTRSFLEACRSSTNTLCLFGRARSAVGERSLALMHRGARDTSPKNDEFAFQGFCGNRCLWTCAVGRRRGKET